MLVIIIIIIIIIIITIREFKLHVYGKQQTSDSSWEFHNIANEQVKTGVYIKGLGKLKMS